MVLSKSSPIWEGWCVGAGVVSGFFDNADDFGEAAAGLEKVKAPGIYFTVNPVNPNLLARCCNRLKAADAKTALTSDKDIVCIRWLPIDLDPVRPAGISSNADELAAAVALRDKISAWLEEKGMVGGIPAISGNGAHLVFRLPDLPPTPENIDQVKRVLHAMGDKFTNDQVEVDLKVFNPARIWKLYGTTARKGDSISGRPHRKSYILKSYILKGAK